MKMKKTKKIIGIVLAAAVGISSLSAGTSVYADSEITSVQKHVVVLDPGHGGGESGASAVYKGKVYREEEINWKIANYTMQALSKENNIEVYLTKSKNETKGLSERVMIAKQYHADLLVSQHINDSESSSPNGASVMISKGTYRPKLAVQEKLFGSYVVEELKKLGLRIRFPETKGMEYRMSESGSKYPNGKPRDYYGIVAQSVEANIPGVIIEHAFISNRSDVTRFLSSNAKLKKIGQADANAIVRYCKQLPDKVITETPTPTPTPVPSEPEKFWKEKNGDYYYYIKGKVQKNKILNLEDGIYYVDKTGKRQYGWQTVKEKTYYFQKDGKAQLGWLELDGSWYYFNTKSGFMYKNIMLISPDSSKRYIFDKNGKRCSGWCTYKKNRYYIDKQGYAYTGWLRLNGKWYYFNRKTACMYRNMTVKSASGKKYIFDSKGVCTNRK